MNKKPPIGATTINGLEDYLRKTGGGNGPEDDDGVFSSLWKYWAKIVIKEKQEFFEQQNNKELDVKHYNEIMKLQKTFEMASYSRTVALKAVREHSPTLNNYPILKHLLPT